MRTRHIYQSVLALSALSLCSGLLAQANPPERPSAGDLREEQRLIDKAYLGDADFQIKTARERQGAGRNSLAQQSGLWALEQVAYAKRRLEKHAPKIEEAGGFWGRASESTRKDLRDSYAKVRENYVNTEERLDGLAEGLKKAGFPILSETLNNVRSNSGDDAVRAVNEGMRKAGVQSQGDKGGGQTVTGGTGAGGGETASTGTGGGPVPLPGISGGTATQSGSNVVLTVPGKGALAGIPGTMSADGRYIDSPEFGRIDLSTMRTLPDGTVVAQSDRGVVYLGKDGKWHLLANAKVNSDGTITGADGRTGPLTSFLGAPPPPGFDPTKISGSIGGDVFVNGKRVTVGPNWKNGEQTDVRKDYIDVAGGMLDSETKITLKLISAAGSGFNAQEIPGERRNWNFAIRVGDEKKASGSISFVLTVDGGGPTGFTIKSWEAVDASGTRAAVTPAAGKPEAVAMFTKGGKYETFASGETEWGTPFRIKGPVIEAYP